MEPGRTEGVQHTEGKTGCRTAGSGNFFGETGKQREKFTVKIIIRKQKWRDFR